MHSHHAAGFDSDQRQNVKLGHQVLQSAYSTFLFTIMSRNDWLKAVENAVGVYTYLGTLAGLTMVKAGIYLYDLLVSKNKNLGKVASFLREFFAATLLTLAVIGGFGVSAVLGTLMPIFFVVSMAIGAAYNIATALYNAYHCVTKTDVQICKKHKENLKKYATAATISTIGTIILSLLMLTPIAHVAMTIVNACYNAFCFSYGVYKAIKIYQKQKQDEILMLDSSPTEKDEQNKEVEFAYLSSQKEMDTLGNTKAISKNNESKLPIPEANIKNDYFFNKNRAGILSNQLFKQPNVHCYIFDEVRDKINSLNQGNDADRLKNRLFSQERKRLLKIECLEKLKELILNESKTIADFNDLLREPQFNHFFSNPFQSFFRQKSDTQDIFECAEKYFFHFRPASMEEHHDIKINNGEENARPNRN